MKVGDLVRMNPKGLGLLDDLWGIGLVIAVTYEKTSIDIEVLWSKIGSSWEMPAMLDIINESR